ncbi:hypothetical protein BDR03DRAFT_953551 [Suillus americanus]|nr:hypothetical protein BDR03DRAFT_953551 [Suillus americanus]
MERSLGCGRCIRGCRCEGGCGLVKFTDNARWMDSEKAKMTIWWWRDLRMGGTRE